MPISLEEIERVYRQGYPRFYRLAWALTSDHEQAVDAVQESFARVIRGRMRFRGGASFETWLWRTLVNVCIDGQRRSSVVREHTAERAAFESGVPSVNGEPGEWPELRAAIASLPERQRLILFLRHYADLDYDAIAVVVGVRRGTVAATLHQAHWALRRTLMGVAR